MKDGQRTFKAFVQGLACFSLWVAFAAPAFAAADPYPSKPVKFIIPSAAGGSLDIIARVVTPRLSELLGKPVVIENRGGAQVVGLDAVAKSSPDGYTMTIISDTYVHRPALGGKMPFDPMKAFAPVAYLGTGTSVLTVNPNVPAKNVKEFIALLKQKPGQVVCAITTVGSVAHLAVALFKSMSGTDFKIVHFKSSSAAQIDLIGGHSQFGVSNLLSAKPEAEAGKLRILGVTSMKRSSVMPDVPTIAESGVPGYDVPSWWGLMVPAGTPQPIVTKLSQAAKDTLATPEIQKRLAMVGGDPDFKGPKELNAIISASFAKWTRLGKEANIQLEED